MRMAGHGAGSAPTEPHSYPETWIEWFCKQAGHSYFCEIDPTFIEDTFNLYGLNSEVEKFQECINIILGGPPRSDREGLSNALYKNCQTLYGLIHARFIISSRGLSLMGDKMDDAVFGTCPRLLCGSAPVLPLGLSHVRDESGVLLTCPRCEEVYVPPPARSPCARDLDGAFFGPTFPHLLLLPKPSHLPKATDAYVPRIYGFRVSGQRGRMSCAQSCWATHTCASCTSVDKEVRSEAGMPPALVHGAESGGQGGAGAGYGCGTAHTASQSYKSIPFRYGKPPLTSPYPGVLSAPRPECGRALTGSTELDASVAGVESSPHSRLEWNGNSLHANGSGSMASSSTAMLVGTVVDDFLDEEDEASHAAARRANARAHSVGAETAGGVDEEVLGEDVTQPHMHEGEGGQMHEMRYETRKDTGRERVGGVGALAATAPPSKRRKGALEDV